MDRIKRRKLLAGTTAGLVASALPSMLSGCSHRTLEDRSAEPSQGDASAGAGGSSGAAGSGGPGDAAARPLDAGDAGAGGAASQQDGSTLVDAGSPSCAEMGQRDRVIDFQATSAIMKSNPLGFPSQPALFRPDPKSLPWLTEPFCECYNAETLGAYLLADGGTSIAFLAGLPYALPDEPGGATFAWNNDDLLEHVAEMDARYPGRILAHPVVMPNDRLELQLEMMERLAPRAAAWKVFTEWTPTAGGAGSFLHEGGGPAVIAKAIDLGVPIIAVEKGKTFLSTALEHSSPRDVGPAANMFPDARIVVCNAAFEHGLDHSQTSAPDLERPDEDLGWGRGVGEWPEGPYEENDPSVMEKYPLSRGVNSLIKSLRDAGIGPNGSRLDGAEGPLTHVYVTPGSGWPSLISRPEEAMHFWGKLLLHVGEDRVLWGTASPDFGPPRLILEEFRRFEIGDELRERYGYPALTPAVKAKILGGNALRMLAETGRELERCEPG